MEEENFKNQGFELCIETAMKTDKRDKVLTKEYKILTILTTKAYSYCTAMLPSSDLFVRLHC